MEQLQPVLVVAFLVALLAGAGKGLGSMFIGFGTMFESICNGLSRLIRARRGDPELPEPQKKVVVISPPYAGGHKSIDSEKVSE